MVMPAESRKFGLFLPRQGQTPAVANVHKDFQAVVTSY